MRSNSAYSKSLESEVAELRTEEEQVELIKNWWKENGNSLLISIAVAVAAVFGWKTWVSNQEAQAANASALYENISSVVTAAQVDEAQLQSVFFLGDELKSDYASSVYTPMASMLLARAAVEATELDKAKTELQFVTTAEAADAAMKQLAHLRLARLAMAMNDLAAAQTSLDAAGVDQYPGLYHELSGDLAVAQGDLAAARDAYTKAVAQADPQSRSLIQLKLDDIAQGEASK